MPIGAGAAALIGAGTAVLGTGADLYAKAKMNKKTRKWNEQMYATQRKDALADWEMQNIYNSPEAHMQRFKDAGLNPNLIYGQTNEASPIRSVEAKGWNPDPPSFEGLSASGSQGLGAYYDAQVKQATLDNLKTQNQVLENESQLKAAQTIATLTGEKRASFDLGVESELKNTTLDYRKELLRNLYLQFDLSVQKNDREAILQRSTLALQAEEILVKKIGREKAKEEINNLKRDGRLKDFETYLNEKGLTKSDPTYMRLIVEFLQRVGIIK